MKRSGFIKYNLYFVFTLLMQFAFYSCELESDLDKRIDEDDHEIQTYLKENNEEATKDDSGIYYKAITTNSSGTEINVGDILLTRYKVTEMYGDVVDEVADTAMPVKFGHVNAGIIPAGINYGVSRMKTGEKYRFYVPSYLAYSDYYNSDYFGPYANFIVDMEIIDIVDSEEQELLELDSINSYIAKKGIENIVERTSGLRYADIEEGTGNSPHTGSYVTFHFTRKYLNDTIIRTTTDGDPVSLYIGNNSAVAGLEEGLTLMKEGGKAIMIMPSSLGFGAGTLIIPEEIRKDLLDNQLISSEVQPYSPLVYEVELIDIL